jgi:predicted metal-dependent peptidase
MKDVQGMLNRVKLELWKGNETFLTTLIANLRLRFTDEIPTAGTNGVDLYFNPEFARKVFNQSAREKGGKLKGLLLHEAKHVVYDHYERGALLRDSQDKTLWNIAGDHLINNELISSGYEIPDGGLCDPKYKGWSTKEIYDDLKENQETITLTIPDLDVPLPEGMTQTQVSEAIKGNILKAAMQAEACNDGNSIPISLRKKLEELRNPKLPWNVILQNYMSDFAQDDYSWRRPNRRYWPDPYLPSRHSAALNQLTVGIDVSGSIGDEDMRDFMSEVSYIFETLKPKKLRLMTFDTRVIRDEVFGEGDDLKTFSSEGYGGTNVVPLINSLREDAPELCVIFTDGYFSKPYLNDLETSLIWIIKGSKFEISRGEVIYYDQRDS